MVFTKIFQSNLAFAHLLIPGKVRFRLLTVSLVHVDFIAEQRDFGIVLISFLLKLLGTHIYRCIIHQKKPYLYSQKKTNISSSLELIRRSKYAVVPPGPRVHHLRPSAPTPPLLLSSRKLLIFYDRPWKVLCRKN